jgi:hypothetical protein
MKNPGNTNICISVGATLAVALPNIPDFTRAKAFARMISIDFTRAKVFARMIPADFTRAKVFARVMPVDFTRAYKAHDNKFVHLLTFDKVSSLRDLWAKPCKGDTLLTVGGAGGATYGAELNQFN